MTKENNILLYEDENGKTSINVRFAEEDIWITQTQLAEYTRQHSKTSVCT